MDPSSSMFEAVMYPTALLAAPMKVESPSDYTFEESQTNPKNRPNSLELRPNHEWLINDVDADGTRFFAIPKFAIGKPPPRIDVYIPDQLHHPRALRHVLQSHKALLVGGGRELSKFGICRLILQRLHSWSAAVNGNEFEAMYYSLPFGSRIVLDAISANVDSIPIHFIPNYDVERQWLSVQELQDLWQLPPGKWPPILDHSCLQLQSQIHEAISVVRLSSRSNHSELFAFKSVSTDVKYFYHELRMLLIMDRHRHIIASPLYVVTKKCLFGGKTGVCGFILEYYPHGTLRDALQRAPAGLGASPRYQLQDRLRWARQILSALVHIKQSPMRFYTDLKPNNVLLARFDDGIGAMLVDFEQRGSWYSWSPPEVYYVEYLEYLVASRLTSKIDNERYRGALERYMPGWKPHNRKAMYAGGSPQGYSQAWLSLTEREQESAQVFMIGKLLWCIFEGVSFPNSCVTVETFREEPSEQSFPEFRISSPPIRELIQQCTAGAPEWSGRLPNVVRVEDKLFPRGMTGRFGERQGASEQTQEAARSWWMDEIRNAKQFVEARIRRRSGCENAQDSQLLGFLEERPSMEEVQKMLDNFSGPDDASNG